MKKIIIACLSILIISCQSVADWREEAVLLPKTVESARVYIEEQYNYLSLIESRNNMDVKDNLTTSELDNFLDLEKKIAQSSQKVLNSWFNFFLDLHQDPGYSSAYKGHYFFRQGLLALAYVDDNRRNNSLYSVSDSKQYKEILLLEGDCRLAVGEIVAFNNSVINTKDIFKKIKKIYKSMD
ncbi:MAG: hypothetical protein B6229_02040 [Spirochaetaceae bacterium 4572_7]|nr:MAG: hypothetical protein B6229_02040 [Spirochaetaceae bacterium 4572_7]